jgi:hypothetical protein
MVFFQKFYVQDVIEMMICDVKSVLGRVES